MLSLFAIAQINLRYRLLPNYSLSNDATLNKGKATLFVFEQPDTFSSLFLPDAGKRTGKDTPDFTKEMVIGIALHPTNKPPKLSVSRVFVQDSTLTVRYINIADTAYANNPAPDKVQPLLLLAIPKQTVLKTRLIENGKVLQTLTKR